MKVPGVFICFTDDHKELLANRLVNRVFHAMQEQGNLYQPELAALLAPNAKKRKQKKEARVLARNPPRHPPQT